MGYIRVVTIYLDPMLPSSSSGQPGDGPGAHCPSIRPCSRWGLASGMSPFTDVRSYRTISPLPRTSFPQLPRSVVPQLSSRRLHWIYSVGEFEAVWFLCHFPSPQWWDSPLKSLGVTQHPARWSPDFPLPRSSTCQRARGSGHPAYLAHRESNIPSVPGQANRLCRC